MNHDWSAKARTSRIRRARPFIMSYASTERRDARDEGDDDDARARMLGASATSDEDDRGDGDVVVDGVDDDDDGDSTSCWCCCWPFGGTRKRAMTPEERALANEARRGASEAAVRRAEAFEQSGGGRAARAAEAEHKRAATGSGDDHYARMAKDWAS